MLRRKSAPCPEVPLVFNPLEHLIRPANTVTQIARVPNNRSHLLRVYVRSDDGSNQGALNTADQAIRLAHHQQTHMAELRRIGIAVPAFTSFVGKVATSGCNAHEIGIYTFVPKLSIRSITEHQWDSLKPMLLRYLDWVEQTDQTLVFDDIYFNDQYGQLKDGTVALIDIEPRMQDPLTMIGTMPLIHHLYTETIDRSFDQDY